MEIIHEYLPDLATKIIALIVIIVFAFGAFLLLFNLLGKNVEIKTKASVFSSYITFLIILVGVNVIFLPERTLNLSFGFLFWGTLFVSFIISILYLAINGKSQSLANRNELQHRGNNDLSDF